LKSLSILGVWLTSRSSCSLSQYESIIGRRFSLTFCSPSSDHSHGHRLLFGSPAAVPVYTTITMKLFQLLVLVSAASAFLIDPKVQPLTTEPDGDRRQLAASSTTRGGRTSGQLRGEVISDRQLSTGDEHYDYSDDYGKGKGGYSTGSKGKGGYSKGSKGKGGYSKGSKGKGGYSKGSKGKGGYSKGSKGKGGYSKGSKGKGGYSKGSKGECLCMYISNQSSRVSARHQL